MLNELLFYKSLSKFVLFAKQKYKKSNYLFCLGNHFVERKNDFAHGKNDFVD